MHIHIHKLVKNDVIQIFVNHRQIVDHHFVVDDIIMLVDENIPETSPSGRTPLSETPCSGTFKYNLLKL